MEGGVGGLEVTGKRGGRLKTWAHPLLAILSALCRGSGGRAGGGGGEVKRGRCPGQFPIEWA